MKTSLKTICFICCLYVSWAQSMNDMYNVMAKDTSKITLYNFEKESSDSETASETEEQSYNLLNENGFLPLCEIIRNNGCEEALNFLKDLSNEQIDINSKEGDGKNNALKETIKLYGLDRFAIRLLLELYNRGAELDAEDEENLKQTTRGKILLFYIQNPDKLKKLAEFEKKGDEFFKKDMEKKSEVSAKKEVPDKINIEPAKFKILKNKDQTNSKRCLIKYIILGSIGICSIYVLFKIKKKKDNGT